MSSSSSESKPFPQFKGKNPWFTSETNLSRLKLATDKPKTVVASDWKRYYSWYVDKAFTRTINIDTSTRCLMQCPFCSRQNFATGKLHIKTNRTFYGDLTPENALQMADAFDRISFCGQISDPIFHKNLFSIFEALDKGAAIRTLEFHTVASGKKMAWWERVFSYMENAKYKTDLIIGIDGIDQKTASHRIGQNFEEAWEVLRYFADNKRDNINITWQFIPFLYNEDEVLTAAETAVSLGINLLLLKSSRHVGEYKTNTGDKKYAIGADLYTQEEFEKKFQGHLPLAPTKSFLKSNNGITSFNDGYIKTKEDIKELERALNES